MAGPSGIARHAYGDLYCYRNYWSGLKRNKEQGK